MRRFEESDLRVAAALARNGWTNAEIAAETGWNKSTIQQHLHESGVRAGATTRRPKYAPERIQIMKRAREAGLTIEDAAAKAGIAAATFYDWRAQGLVGCASLKKIDTSQEKYRRIYARYLAGTETPDELAAVYKMHKETLLRAWRRLELPLDRDRTIRQRATTMRAHKSLPDAKRLAEQWILYSKNLTTANEARAALGMSWIRLRRVWQEMNFPVDLVADRHRRNSWRMFAQACSCARAQREAGQYGQE